MKEYLEIVIDKNSIHYKLPIVDKKELPIGKYSGKIWDGDRNTYKKVEFQVRLNRTTTISP